LQLFLLLLLSLSISEKALKIIAVATAQAVRPIADILKRIVRNELKILTLYLFCGIINVILNRIGVKIMIIDMHSHILPGIDDGSRNIEESVKMLDRLAEKGTDLVLATPHFYCEEQSITSFLEKRNNAYEQLKPHLKPEHPKILLGAEVLYSPVLVGNEDISKLAIEGTDFVLFEMPYQKITSEIVENVSKIVDFMDVKLLIAHIERYLNFTSFSELSELLDLDVIGQIKK